MLPVSMGSLCSNFMNSFISILTHRLDNAGSHACMVVFGARLRFSQSTTMGVLPSSRASSGMRFRGVDIRGVGYGGASLRAPMIRMTKSIMLTTRMDMSRMVMSRMVMSRMAMSSIMAQS